MLQNYPIFYQSVVVLQAAVLHELLGSGMTFKEWLKHTINPTSDADLVAVKALRFLLKVKETIFFQNAPFCMSENFQNSYVSEQYTHM